MLLSVVVGLIPLSGFKFDDANRSNVTLVMPTAPPASRPHAPYIPPVEINPRLLTDDKAPGAREEFVPDPQWGLRNAPGFDSRVQPRMRKLFDDYRSSSATALLFGIASDASVVLGWGSSVWYRILTDFGIVGFIWGVGLFFTPLLQLWREKRFDVPVMIFCGLFLMSFYQRPIIWLSAPLLIYFAGIYAMKEPARSP